MRILMTGTAGFIGFHLAKRLLDRGDEVYGADNLNNYYDVRLKHARLAQLEGRPGFTFQKLDLADRNAVPEMFQRVRPQRVVHLAAQAGVRYIDDIVEGVVRVSDRVAAPNPSWSGERPDPGTSKAPCKLYNIGNHNPVELLYFIKVLEMAVGQPARMRLLPMQPGDVPATYADVDDLRRDVGFKPSTTIEEGVHRFVDWYRRYYGRTPAPSSVLRPPSSVARPLSSVVRPTEALKNRAPSIRKARCHRP